MLLHISQVVNTDLVTFALLTRQRHCDYRILWFVSTERQHPNDNVTIIVSTLLGHRRKKQVDLAKVLGFDSGTMSRALNGKRKWTLDDIVAMADFFEVSPALFFEDPANLIRSRSSATTESDGGDENYLITSLELVDA